LGLEANDERANATRLKGVARQKALIEWKAQLKRNVRTLMKKKNETEIQEKLESKLTMHPSPAYMKGRRIKEERFPVHGAISLYHLASASEEKSS